MTMKRREQIVARMKEIGDELERLGRHQNLTVPQEREWRRLYDEHEELNEERKQLERTGDLQSILDGFRDGTAVLEGGALGMTVDGAATGHGRRVAAHPLVAAPASLEQLQRAIVAREGVRISAANHETRAALTTTTHGAPRAWGANVAAGPRLLHLAAGVKQESVSAIFAQHPVLTLPAASAGVGESVTLAEYASSTAGSVTLSRFGRFTDLSNESMIGANAAALVGAHTIGVARDLDKVLIDAVEAAAGAAVAFTADVPAAIRKAIAQVLDNTAASSAAELVVLTHPDNAALLQDVAPIGGDTMAEGFQRFSGALVYASSAVDTGFMAVANLRAGAIYFEARGLTTETDVAVKTDVLTVATSVIGGYGLTLNGGTSGAYIKVDVVTP